MKPQLYECKDCHLHKVRSEFYENSDGSGTGLMKRCRICWRAYMNAHQAAKRASAPKPLPVYRERGDGHGQLQPIDLVPCARCGLRGHVAGDQDRCIQPISLGLGGQVWV